MANEGILELELRDVRGRPAQDANVTVRFFKDGHATRIGDDVRATFPPGVSARLPAFPQANNVSCDITPTRYRMRSSGFFTLTDGERIRRSLSVLRVPAQWNARFERWTQLPTQFDPLRKVLDASPNLRVKGKAGTIASFTASGYDDVDDRRTIEAKAAMLNLHGKLSALTIPATSRPWFSFVTQLIEIGRERMIGIVDPAMGDEVRALREGGNKDYKPAPAGLHHANFPSEFQVLKSKMFSLKTTEANGNLQLTLAPGRDALGNDVLLLDADIDENGRLLAHLADLFKHKISGGTHPFDIHEYLALAHPQLPLGYDLL